MKRRVLNPSSLVSLLAAILMCEAASPAAAAGSAATEPPAEFVVWSDAADFVMPRIVLQFDEEKDTGVDWKLAVDRPWYDQSEVKELGDALESLREGIEKMCGQRIEVVNAQDLSRGIVFTTLAGASEVIRGDSEALAALRSDGSDDYNHCEAFFVRSEPQRLLIVANTINGLVCAVPELLESVGYEVLAMGPHWVHIPDAYRNRLAFRISRAGRRRTTFVGSCANCFGRDRRRMPTPRT